MSISHDGHIHKGRDFPVKDSRAQRGYRNFVKAGSRVELDHDLANVNLTGNHAMDDHFNAMAATGLHLTVMQSPPASSKARKAQRQLNSHNESRLAIRASWCQGCLNYLHNCSCPATAAARGAAAASADLISRVYADIADKDRNLREREDSLKRQQRKDKRLQRKAQERAARGATS